MDAATALGLRTPLRDNDFVRLANLLPDLNLALRAIAITIFTADYPPQPPGTQQAWVAITSMIVMGLIVAGCVALFVYVLMS